jgi:competence protein ComGC
MPTFSRWSAGKIRSSDSPEAGFTLLEFLVILAIVFVLLILFAIRLGSDFVPRAQDAHRKGDIEKIRIALEDYYNDNKCYPEQEMLIACGTDEFAPYMDVLPCDRGGQDPYLYEPDQVDRCSGYRLLARLRYDKDPEIVDMPCYAPYNYGVASGLPLVPETCLAAPSPSPDGSGGLPYSPTVPPSYLGPYACDPLGECNVYANPAAAGCPGSFATYQICLAACTNPANYCPQ